MKRVILIAIIISLSIGGFFLIQLNRPIEYNNLYQAERLMKDRPDSALIILQNIHSPKELVGEEQALYALLYTQAKYKNGIQVTDDSLIHLAEKYYSNGNDSIRKAWTYFYLAQIYRDMQDSEKALIYFQKADIASQNYENNNFSYLLNFYWGKLLQKQQPYDESINKFNNAIHYAQLEHDTTGLILSLGELGWTYIWKHDYKKSQTTFKEGLNLITSPHQQALKTWLLQYLVTSYYKERQFDTALQYSDECLKEESTTSLPYTTWGTRADIFIELHQYDSAKYYFEKDTRYTTPYEKANFHRIWAKYEESMGNYPKALEHQKLCATYLDTIYETKSHDKLTELQKKYDYSVIKNENNELKLKDQKTFIWKLCVGLIFIVVMGCSLYYYERERRKKAQAINSKNELMLQMQKMIQEHKKTAQEAQHMREKMLQSSEVYQKIESVNIMTEKDKAAKKVKLSKAEMKNLMEALDFCYNNFTKRLQKAFPLLTQDDLVICSLIKMKTEALDIFFLLDTNKIAYKKRKTRIKHDKMNLSEESVLDEFIRDF